jgi:succinoglycan biosynthesis protein ExoM
MLSALLHSLAGMEFRKSRPRVEIVVVDNDAEGSAAAAVESLRRLVPFPIRYSVEPERNISLARNSGIALALEGDTDFIAFVDDDETVSPTWLDELVAAQAQYGTDIVGGPVEPRFEEHAPAWIVGSRFFHRPRPPSGTRLRQVGTGNALVRAELLRDERLRFDPSFGMSGGGDSEFFLRRERQGAEIAWVDEALVTERVAASRATARWMLQRAFRNGNGAVLCERAMAPRHRRLAFRVSVATGRLLFGAAILLPSVLLGRRGMMRSLCLVAYGMGGLAALAGYRYFEYRTIHGE